jgi:hypothetical protein
MRSVAKKEWEIDFLRLGESSSFGLSARCPLDGELPCHLSGRSGWHQARWVLVTTIHRRGWTMKKIKSVERIVCEQLKRFQSFAASRSPFSSSFLRVLVADIQLLPNQAATTHTTAIMCRMMCLMRSWWRMDSYGFMRAYTGMNGSSLYQLAC